MISLRYAAAPRELAIGRTAVLLYGSAVHTPHRSALVCHSPIHEQDLDVVLLHTPRHPRSVIRLRSCPLQRELNRLLKPSSFGSLGSSSELCPGHRKTSSRLWPLSHSCRGPWRTPSCDIMATQPFLSWSMAHAILRHRDHGLCYTAARCACQATNTMVTLPVYMGCRWSSDTARPRSGM